MSTENPLADKLKFSEADNLFKSIGDVSAEIGVPPHVLRFWESKFLDIKPHKRRGGHRYYSQKDVEAIYEIKKLLYEHGYTIKGAQKKLRENNNMSKEQHSLFVSNAKSEDNDISVQAAPEPELTLFSDTRPKVVVDNTKPDAGIIQNFFEELEGIKNILKPVR